jgi:hypothetical protein
VSTRRRLPSFRPKEPARASKFNRLRSIGAELANLSFGKGLKVIPSSSGRVLDVDFPFDAIWARVESSPSGSWTQVVRRGGMWVDTGRSGPRRVILGDTTAAIGKIVPGWVVDDAALGGEFVGSYLRHNCCECPTVFCVRAVCWSPFIGGNPPIEGATVEIREAADPVGSGDVVYSGETDDEGRLCVTITEAGDYDSVVTHPDYTRSVAGPHAVTCEHGLTIEAIMCRRLTAYTFIASTGPCPVDGAAWSVSGPRVNASGTTGADGKFSFDYVLDEDESCPPEEDADHDFTIVPAPCEGLAETTQSQPLHPICWGSFEASVGFPILGPAPGFVRVDRRYGLNEALNYSDGLGSCCVVYDPARNGFPLFPGLGIWWGWYDYTDSDAAKVVQCGGPYDGFCTPNYPYTLPVRVGVKVFIGATDCSETLQVQVVRIVPAIHAAKDCLFDNPCLNAPLGKYLVPNSGLADGPCTPQVGPSVYFSSRFEVVRGSAAWTGNGPLSIPTAFSPATPPILRPCLSDPIWGKSGGTAILSGSCDGACA